MLTVPAERVEEAKKWLANNAKCINIGVKENCDKLYIECTCTSGNDTATAVISRRHTNFTYLAHNGKVLHNNTITAPLESHVNPSAADGLNLTARLVYDYATTAPIEELDFIRETVKYNDAAATEGLKGYGLHTGKILMENAAGDIVHTVVARTVAASDARMDGCTLPVYSNYGKAKGCDDESITRALVLNHLMSIYIKRGIGRLSALCGLVNASIGVTCGIVYLHGGSFDQMCFAIKNMINTIAGMVCDGAKPSCALKMSTGLYSAFVSAELAYHDCVVDATDGLSESDVDCSIRNLGRLGCDGMDQVDDMVLDIMTHKQ